MNISERELTGVAQSVRVSGETLEVDLADRRTIAVPLAWFPRLSHGKPDEREHWRMVGRAEGIHWPDLDEDISVESLLAGRRSNETHESLRRWLQARQSTI
jgi:hypothetical protein